MIIYETRYQARKARRYGEVVVKVEGGYALMSCEFYRIWKRQK